MSAPEITGRAMVAPAYLEAAQHQYGMAQGRVDGGFVFVSGQIGFTPDGQPAADPAEQGRLALTHLGAILTEAGCTFDDVVELTTYHVGGVAAANTWFLPIKAAFFGAPYPAWTAVGVADLAIPGAVIEIAAIAKLPE